MDLKRSDPKKNGKIVVIEGLWSIGKTTFCRFLEKYYNFYFIQEPNHVKAGLAERSKMFITNWYFKEHLKNLILGFKTTKNKKNIVIERSPVSSIAFAKTCFENPFFCKNKFIVLQRLLLKMKNNSKTCVMFLFLKPKNIKLLSQYLYSSENKNIQIYSNENLLKKCDRNTLLFLQRLNKKKLIKLEIIKTDKFSTKNFQNIISKIL
jgi:deoxyadenosine/deoxycytidine kinase